MCRHLTARSSSPQSLAYLEWRQNNRCQFSAHVANETYHFNYSPPISFLPTPNFFSEHESPFILFLLSLFFWGVVSFVVGSLKSDTEACCCCKIQAIWTCPKRWPDRQTCMGKCWGQSVCTRFFSQDGAKIRAFLLYCSTKFIQRSP